MQNCAFSGHRVIPIEKQAMLRDLLRRAIAYAYENGCRSFFCGGAIGFDTYAAKEVILLTADNPIGAGTGDLVNLRSETGPVLKAAAVLYMLPLVLFFAGYALAAVLDLSGALVGCLAFALSVALIIGYDRRMAKNNTIYTITGFAADPLLSEKRG
jgi:sigma-E factor negative regulatory protein RseC